MTGRIILAGALVIALVAAAFASAAVIRGGPGPDRLIGTKRADTIVGKRGRDVIKGKRGFDTIRGGAGNDRIRARDGEPDTINCGRGGRDKVVVDVTEDGVYDCERVREPV